jgi:hypothetical protein
MSDYRNVSIDIVENGFAVTVYLPEPQHYVFTNMKSLNAWLRENLSATGEVERFSKALDDEDESDTLELYTTIHDQRFVVGSSIPTTGSCTATVGTGNSYLQN